MKNCFISSTESIPAIETFIPLTTLDEWVKSYGTDEEHSRLKLLASEAREKIETLTGLRIGKREFILKTDHYPHKEYFDIYPALSGDLKVEVWNDELGDYEELDSELYSLEQKSDKFYMLLFSGDLPKLVYKETAVKITVNCGCEDLAKIPSMAVSAIRCHIETYFRDKMPSEITSGIKAFDTCINHLRLWL